MTFSIETYSKKFEKKNNEVRAYYLEKLETDRNLGIKIDQLVEIVHEIHPKWSLNKIAQYIVSVNEDLDGFSSRTIYREMSDEKKILYGQTTKPTGSSTTNNRKELQNNVTEDEIDNCQSNVIEDSSNKKNSYNFKKENQSIKVLDDAYKSLNNDADEEEDDSVEEPEIDNTLNQLPKPVVSLAKKIELPQNKLRLIANPRLKEHPEIQKDLVKEIAPLTIDEAKIKIAQEVRDLETGALFKSGKSYCVHTHLRDKIESNPEVEKSPYEYYFELSKDMLKFLEHITGHEIVKGEFEYTEKHIEYTEKHRIEMIKSLDERTVRALKDDLKVVRSGINSMLDIIDKEVIGKKDSD